MPTLRDFNSRKSKERRPTYPCRWTGRNSPNTRKQTRVQMSHSVSSARASPQTVAPADTNVRLWQGLESTTQRAHPRSDAGGRGAAYSDRTRTKRTVNQHTTSTQPRRANTGTRAYVASHTTPVWPVDARSSLVLHGPHGGGKRTYAPSLVLVVAALGAS